MIRTASLLAALALAWPFVVYFAGHRIGLGVLGAGLTALLLARLLASAASVRWKLAGSIAALIGVAAWLRWRDERLLVVQPVLIDLGLCIAFGASLVRGVPLIERIARARGMPVAPFNLGYLRKLTAVWAAYFALAAGIAAWTVWRGDREAWLLWNGILVHVGTGLLLVGELPVRRRFRRKLEKLGRLPPGA